MAVISEQQVRDAEGRAQDAEAKRDAAAKAVADAPYSDLAAAELTEAVQLAARLRANASELAVKFEQQLEEERRRVSRPEREKEVAAEIRAAAREMDVREKAFVEAAVAAQAAVVALMDAGAAYGAGLAGHVEFLAEAGLDFNGGESGGERSILGVDRLKIRGREFHPFDVGAVGVWVLRRAVAARLSPQHHLVSAFEWTSRDVNIAHPELQERVPAPQSRNFPEPLRMRMPQAG